MNTNVTVKKQKAVEKSFPIDVILSVTTGRLLSERGFDAFHECMDFLFPGIMTVGAAVMAPVARLAIENAYPMLKDLPPCTDDNWKEWIAERKKTLPHELTLTGPLDVPQKEIEKRFKDFAKKGKK